MKLKWAIGIGVVVACAIGYNDFHIRMENHRLKAKEDLQTIEISLLRSEVNTLTRRQTYEEGYRDAVTNALGGTYKDGYHAAINQAMYEKEVMAEAEKLKKEVPIGKSK